jgi:hypothetical protein
MAAARGGRTIWMREGTVGRTLFLLVLLQSASQGERKLFLNQEQRRYLKKFTFHRDVLESGRVITLFFLPPRVRWSLLCLCRPFMIFGGCLNSYSEFCHSKQARYQLIHPSSFFNLSFHTFLSFLFPEIQYSGCCFSTKVDTKKLLKM